MGRETNIILIDEFDKVDSVFYNAFYELFDTGKFVDSNYELDLKKCVFILTSNFNSIDEIKQKLGPAIYSRLGINIHYNLLSNEFKIKIVQGHYKKITSQLSKEETAIVSGMKILKWYKENVDSFTNIRSLKNSIENTIFKVLSISLIQNS